MSNRMNKQGILRIGQIDSTQHLDEKAGFETTSKHYILGKQSKSTAARVKIGSIFNPVIINSSVQADLIGLFKKRKRRRFLP